MKQTRLPACSTSFGTGPWATAGFQNGFTLIEVLLVMALFSIGILAIMTLHVTAINSNAKARKIMMTSIIMGDQFEKLISADYENPELDPLEISVLNETGFFVDHTVSATLIPNIKKIDLTVTLDVASGKSYKVIYYKRSPG